MTVIVFGSINMDLTAYLPRLPKPGETLFGDSFITAAGGKGANQAVATARLGAPVKLFGRVGDDGFGRDHLSKMKKEGVDIEGVAVDPNQNTGIAIIHVDADGENTIVVISGANMSIGQDDIDSCVTALDSADILLLQLEIPLEANLTLAYEAHRRGVPIILDPAPAGTLPDELFPLIDVITPNEVEVESIVGFPVHGQDDAFRATSRLRAMGVRSPVVKMGASGVYFETETGRGHIPAFKIKAVDSVAAGDAFNGGVATALSEGMPFRDALRWGAAAGALAVSREGAMPSLPRRAELEKLLQEDKERQ